MIIERLEVRNFRALSEAAVDLHGVNYLVGRNGAGKSTLLNALAVFFKQASTTGPEEFTLGNTTSAIEISVIFRDLGPTASNEFARYVRSGMLRVTKRVAWENGRLADSYHGTSWRFEVSGRYECSVARSASAPTGTSRATLACPLSVARSTWTPRWRHGKRTIETVLS